LHECDRCRAVLVDFERNKTLFRSMDQPEQPTQAFWDDTFRNMRTMGQAEPLRPSIGDGFRASRRQWQAGFAAAVCVAAAVVVPLTSTRGIHSARTGISGQPAPSDDSIDTDDISTFVRAHTESAAYQPLGDPDRQQMIAADADGMRPDAAEAATDADVSP
jgi:hypothetical protein